ncbi:hypothetical protein DFH08DRAFT_1051626 [Mycena albidolilacea]|uniref:Uncharacterized protein n=1 Tax=Mycena albidolilacea TaxID=1033008 RepID=A0AAD6Z4R1_9AGAR|nr:hypothetical protein DFH08DRAFT_1051626 [Mycena albidolilacea]
MQEQKLELYNLDEPGTFPDVSNTRYGCYTYAAAEVVCFHGLIQELATEIVLGKAKAGTYNHVEKNILKGLNCAATMTELVALALYGASVSWSYMATVRGTKDEPINLLFLTDLHRKLPVFCAHIANNPNILLDATTPLDQLTIDGRPFRDEFLLTAITQISGELPNLSLAISSMFSGAETWMDSRATVFIPSTNDCSEGMLGTYRVHMRHHPNSTAHSFSNQTRAERNNTEAFIKKFCDAAVEKYVMREVRKDGASGRRAKFRRAWAALQREKAETATKRREKTALRKRSAAARLASTALEFDVAKIKAMSSACLKDQLHVYKDVLKDEELVGKLWKNMATVAVRRDLVLEARGRELAKRTTVTSTPSDDITPTTEDIVVEEYGFSQEEDRDWEDVDS